MFTLYIIYSTHLNKYYVGYSEDVQKRLAEHNSGISDFTSKTNDWQLKYTEIFANRKQAISREREKSKTKKAANILSG